MPISGTITTAAGPQTTPTPAAAREAAALKAALRDAAAPPVVPVTEHGRSAPPPGATPAVGAPGATPAVGAPGGDEKYEAWRVEALARRERAATEAQLAARSEREALARDRGAMEEREKAIGTREARVDEIEKRINAYRYNPHLALQDLSQYGVTFEMLAQAVAQGMASPDQIAAAEAAQARREMEDFRTEQARRDAEAADRAAKERRDAETAKTRREREAREREARERAAAEAEATQEWKAEIRAIAAREAAALPFFNDQIDRGALDKAFAFAESFLAREKRVPTNEEVLAGVEADLQKEAEAMAQVLTRARASRPPAATLSNQLRPTLTPPAPAHSETEMERRRRVVGQLDKIFGR